MISIIHPSRSRPKIASEIASSWLQNAGCEVEYVLSLDNDDDVAYQYASGFPFGKKHNVIFNDNKSAIEAINKAAEETHGDIIIQIADDFQCFPNWGIEIEKLMKRQADWILKTQDGIQDWIITLPIMDRIYYERFGYIYHPAYKHAWSDTELTCVAELVDRKWKSAMMFRHLNGGATKIVDTVSKKNDATFEEGKALFIDRKKDKFGLKPGDISGNMTPNFYTSL
jgi:glycosyltransferase involved in cell wall biosynthesis